MKISLLVKKNKKIFSGSILNILQKKDFIRVILWNQNEVNNVILMYLLLGVN